MVKISSFESSWKRHTARVTAASPKPDDHVALCVRLPRNELVGAECESLTGGLPAADGVATCNSIDRIHRAAYIRQGVRVIARATAFDALVEMVAAAEFDADRFRIEVYDPENLRPTSTRDLIVPLADVMVDHPDLAEPQHRFVVTLGANGCWFGEILTRATGDFQKHDTKPWTTSSSLDARLSRALVNLVPDARSILDPCCGAGSIVVEAASLGIEAVGIDWKPAMVGMTRQNLDHFDYSAMVEQADARTIDVPADAVVTDLPYGHGIKEDAATTQAILDRAATLAPTGVFVSRNDLTVQLANAGYENIAVHGIEKRSGFVRRVHVGRSYHFSL